MRTIFFLFVLTVLQVVYSFTVLQVEGIPAKKKKRLTNGESEIYNRMSEVKGHCC